MSSRKDNEEPLKALVFADGCGASIGQNFTCTKSLLNVPTLSWQLGTLARFGVKEVIVLSSAPVEGLYEDPLGRMKVTPLSSPSWSGEGDAIRDVESRDGMRPVDDFVLVRQGSVFNVDVAELVATHKQRKEADRNWLITTVFRKGAGSASTGLVVGVDTATGTLVKYAEETKEGGISIDVRAENSGLQNGGTVEICSDVLDVGLDVCAPDFLLEFRENFYYDSVRAYVKEKLDGGEAEVFGNRMYAHYLDSRTGQYGTRIHSLASLVQATSDVLSGWMSPVSVSLIKGTPVEEAVQEFQSEFLLEQSTIGSDVTIAVGSTIVESVIGSNVQIGSDVTIKQSILMDGTIVRDRVDVDRSIIEKNCVIEGSSSIRRNCYLDVGVCIGSDFHKLPSHSLVTVQDPRTFDIDDDEEDDDEEDEPVENGDPGMEASNGVEAAELSVSETSWRPEHVGTGGKGRLVEVSVSSKVDPFFVPKGTKPEFECFESDEEDELEEDEEELQGLPESSVGVTNGDVDDLAKEIENSALEDDARANLESDGARIAKFNEEVSETIERAFAEDVDVENTTLEVKSLKLVYHCSFAETLTGVVAGIANAAVSTSKPDQLYGAVDAALQKYKALVEKFNKSREPTHHLHVATGLASALSSNGTLLMYVYKAMYEKDMLDEGGILGWAAAERQRVESGIGNDALLCTVSPLLQWLEDSEEED